VFGRLARFVPPTSRQYSVGFWKRSLIAVLAGSFLLANRVIDEPAGRDDADGFGLRRLLRGGGGR
jgi:hypothetical protein